MKVLHFKTTYLNLSETFINRFVHSHKSFEPVVATCYPKYYTEDVNIYSMPQTPVKKAWNTMQLKLNKSPSFLYDVVQTEKPSVIHGHFGLDSYRLIGLKNYFNIPFVVNFYGYDVIRLPNEFGWKSRYKKLAQEGDLFIVGSEDMKRNIADLGFPEDKIRILKLGMDIDNITFKQRTSADSNLMMVGRMVEKKGFRYAIDAVKTLRDKNIEVQLDLYGDGELRDELEAQVSRLSLQNSITFHGQTENKVIFQELYNHDILLVPSVQAEDGDREGIPQTTVEGMATGIPVIASKHAGLPELVLDEKTGLLVEERNADMLADAIQTYLTDPELAKKTSKNGRQLADKNHNIHTQAKKLEGFYNSLINNA